MPLRTHTACQTPATTVQLKMDAYAVRLVTSHMENSVWEQRHHFCVDPLERVDCLVGWVIIHHSPCAELHHSRAIGCTVRQLLARQEVVPVRVLRLLDFCRACVRMVSAGEWLQATSRSHAQSRCNNEITAWVSRKDVKQQWSQLRIAPGMTRIPRS